MDEREARRAEVLVEHARVVHVLEQNAARRVARVARRVPWSFSGSSSAPRGLRACASPPHLGSSASSRVASRRSTPREKATKKPLAYGNGRRGRAAGTASRGAERAPGRTRSNTHRPDAGRRGPPSRARAPPTRRARSPPRAASPAPSGAGCTRGRSASSNAGPTCTTRRARRAPRPPRRRAAAAAPAAAARRTRRRRRGRRICEKRAVVGARAARCKNARSSCSLPTVSALCGEIGNFSTSDAAKRRGASACSASQTQRDAGGGQRGVRSRHAARRARDARARKRRRERSAESSMASGWSHAGTSGEARREQNVANLAWPRRRPLPARRGGQRLADRRGLGRVVGAGGVLAATSASPQRGKEYAARFGRGCWARCSGCRRFRATSSRRPTSTTTTRW